MAEAFARWIERERGIGGVISAGGSGGTSLATAGMRRLPLGIPKIMVSTMASGNVAPWVGTSDITMIFSVTDIMGLNRFMRKILANAAAALLAADKVTTLPQGVALASDALFSGRAARVLNALASAKSP